jgi:hypothetical protein
MSESYESDVWYYAEAEKPVGPLTLSHLIVILSRVTNAKNVLVWQPSFSTWKNAGSIPELARVILGPPPINQAINADRDQRLSGRDVRETGIDPEQIQASPRSSMYPLYQAAIANRVLVALTAALVICIMWRIYLMQQLLDLVNLYGYGHVPVNLIPGGVSESDSIVLISSYLWYFGLLVCVMYCFYQVRSVLQNNLKQTFKHGFGWTVGSLLIPFINFYRPWVGLGEIRRTAIYVRYKVMRKFDVWTLLFALTFYAALLSTKVISAEEQSLANKPTDAIDQAYFIEAIHLDIFYALSVLILALISFLYCKSIIVSVRETR